MKTVSDQTQNQLRLDRCVGRSAILIEKILTQMHQSNQRKRAYLAAVPSIVILPPLHQVISTGMKIEDGLQKILKIRWNSERSLWDLHLLPDCPPILLSKVSEFPHFPFVSGMPTPYGESPSQFTGMSPTELSVQYRGRKSVARIDQAASTHVSANWVQ